jgi:hypothetical protein
MFQSRRQLLRLTKSKEMLNQCSNREYYARKEGSMLILKSKMLEE